MARLIASSTGRETLPDLTPLGAANARPCELRGLTSQAELLPRWDPVEGEPFQDHGDIGVDEGGIFVRRHPDLILAGMPRAAEVIDAWLLGDQTFERLDVYRLDAYELTLRKTMVAAAGREDGRRAAREADAKRKEGSR